MCVNAIQHSQARHCQAPQEAKSCAGFPGGASAKVGADGTLEIKGGKCGDNIDVARMDNGNFRVSVNGKTEEIDGRNVKAVSIDGGKGNDNIRVKDSVDVPTRINGGKGNDRISNAADDAVIAGGKGNDWIKNVGDGVSIDGGKGRDTLANFGDDARILGGKGNDDIYNFGDDACIDGGKGNDNIFNVSEDSHVKGGRGRDHIRSFGDGNQVDGGGQCGDKTSNHGSNDLRALMMNLTSEITKSRCI
jgi:hypothetical protein